MKNNSENVEFSHEEESDFIKDVLEKILPFEIKYTKDINSNTFIVL